MRPVLTARGVGKAYARKKAGSDAFWSLLLGHAPRDAEPFWAVRDVSLGLLPGESVGIIGRNGSGKSTLLQVLCGIVPPSEGSVSVEGRLAGMLELGAGFDPDFTGRENVYLNAAMLGLNRDEIDARFVDIEAFAEIGRFIEEPVRTYSSGMFVRLAFAVAVHVEPDVLVIDEALAVGDARFSAKCIKRIKSLRERGCTLLFVSHDVGIVRTLCDRAIWLDQGRVRAEGDVFGVTSSYMEYLFQDDGSGTDSAAALASEPVEGAPSAPDWVDQPPPLSRWGRAVGAIRSWSVSSATSPDGRVLHYGEKVVVAASFEVPDGTDAANLSLAFSIKDTRGTDLQVCTTHDEHPGVFGGRTGVVTVRFEFVNRIVDSRCLLVLALEDRTHDAIEYFDYIEGASYFTVLSDVRRFGIFNLPVAIDVG